MVEKVVQINKTISVCTGIKNHKGKIHHAVEKAVYPLTEDPVDKHAKVVT